MKIENTPLPPAQAAPYFAPLPSVPTLRAGPPPKLTVAQFNNLCLRKGWSVQQLAKALGVTERTVQYWRNGRKLPGPVRHLLTMWAQNEQ